MTDREILGRNTSTYHGRISAIIALSLMLALWTLRLATHTIALNQFNSTQVATEPVSRVALMPYPINPFRWHAIMETATHLPNRRAQHPHRLHRHRPHIQRHPQARRSPPPSKPPSKPNSASVYLDWGRWAIPTDLGPQPIPLDDLTPSPYPTCPRHTHWTTIRFDDLRFQYDFRGSGLTDAPSPLTAWVYIVDNTQDAGEVYGHRVQK